MSSLSAAGEIAQISNDDIEVERIRIVRIFRFYSKPDDLDNPIISADESVLNRAMVGNSTIMTPKDVECTVFRKPPIDYIMVLGLFNRSASSTQVFHRKLKVQHL